MLFLIYMDLMLLNGCVNYARKFGESIYRYSPQVTSKVVHKQQKSHSRSFQAIVLLADNMLLEFVMCEKYHLEPFSSRVFFFSFCVPTLPQHALLKKWKKRKTKRNSSLELVVCVRIRLNIVVMSPTPPPHPLFHSFSCHVRTVSFQKAIETGIIRWLVILYCVIYLFVQHNQCGNWYV